jgi:hypothetical protein
MSRFGRFLGGGLDPVKLARNIGMDCDPWQADVLRKPHQRELICAHRQAGKSATASVAAVHAAMYEPGALVLVVSPSQRQSVELFRSMLVLYRSLGRPVAAETENTLSITLENGSRVVALPADPVTIRGYAACRLLIVDEAAFVSDDTMAAVRPMLSVSHGRMLAMSTPYGRRGWFWEASKSSEWRVTTVTADQCPRITPEFLAAERVALGEWRYRQEYACEFTDLAGRMFASADLDAAFAIGQLGGVPQGALFGGSTSPAVLRIVDAPRPSVTSCPYSDNGHHFWNEGHCEKCHVRQDPSQAPPCTHSQRRNGECRECGANLRLPAIGA